MSRVDAVNRLTRLLDEWAAAAAAPDADALLSAEARLVEGLDRFAIPAAAAGDDAPRLATAVAAARGSLARCAVLGTALADGARLVLHAQGIGGHYGRSGVADALAAPRGHRLQARL